jgi:hypothetical protein
MCRADMGGKVASLSSPALPEDPNLGACPTPPPPRPFTAHPAVHRAFSLSLSFRPCFLVGGMLCLPPCRILGRVGISRLATAAPRTLCKVASAMKRHNRISHRNETKRTNAGTGDPILQRGRANSRVWINPNIQDFMDPGVNLCRTQLLCGEQPG